MELILLRHGATEGNEKHQYIGCTDLPLSERGQLQASRRQGTLPVPELLFVSPMLRCRQTAALIWPDTLQVTVPDLRETDFGVFEGKTWAELKDDPAYRAWIDGTGECPGGETGTAIARRVEAAFSFCLEQAMTQQANHWAITAHGGTIMHLLYSRLGETLYRWQPPLCGGWQVTVTKTGAFSDPHPIPNLKPKD